MHTVTEYAYYVPEMPVADQSRVERILRTVEPHTTPEERAELAERLCVSEKMREAVRKRWGNKTPEQRTEFARRTAAARWANKTPEQRVVERAKGRTPAS